ncbi:hypothetical protein Tco_0592620 [Tanacetum coccineum]
MTHEEVEELVNRRVAEEMEAREAAMNLEPMNENKDEQEGGNGGNGGNGNGGNGGNGNGGNGNRGNGENGNVGNGHRNGNHGMNYGGFMPVARDQTPRFIYALLNQLMDKNLPGLCARVLRIRGGEITKDISWTTNAHHDGKILEVGCTMKGLCTYKMWNLTNFRGIVLSLGIRTVENHTRNKMDTRLEPTRGNEATPKSLRPMVDEEQTLDSNVHGALLDVHQTTLDTIIAVELVRGRNFMKTNIFLEGQESTLKIDLRSGYHQLRVREEDISKTNLGPAMVTTSSK